MNTRNKKIIILTLIGLVFLVVSFYFFSKYKKGEIKYFNNINLSKDKESAQKDKPEEVIYEQYAEIINSCDTAFTGDCVNLRSAPSIKSKVFSPLRNGVLLKVSEKVETEGITWYKIYFDEWVRYPNRIGKTAYISAEYVKIIEVKKEITKKMIKDSSTSTENIKPEIDKTKIKKIIVDTVSQTLYAYEGDTLFMQEPVSTGLKDTPTPRGTFSIFSKTPARYIQGPLPGISAQEYDLPGVP